MRVLGIDPGTRLVGYGLIEVQARGRFRYLECGVLKTDGRRPLEARLLELSEGLIELLDEFKPEVMAIEQAYHGKNASSALKLAEARGAFKLLALQRGLGVHEYQPSSVKQMVAGKGRATKAEVQARVGLLCELRRPPPVDAADALAIAICHGQSHASPVPAAARGRGRRGSGPVRAAR